MAPEATIWTAEDLRGELVQTRHDIVFLAGHFSANGTLAADFSTDLLASEVANSLLNMDNTIIFSAGCHAGYNIVNDHGIPQITLEPDWAQAFSSKGATLIGGTGYQYGDTDFLEYSERLYLIFSKELRAGNGPVPIGKALMMAKNEYLATTPELRGIHEKALLEATLFGLPMLSVDMPQGRGTFPPPASIVPSTTLVGSNPGVFLGLETADVSLTPTLVQSTKTLQSVDNISEPIEATYFAGKDGTVTRPSEPALPMELYNVSVPGKVLRGIGFRGGSYTDLPGIVPLTGAAATETRSVHPPFQTDVFYPSQWWQANYFDLLANPASGITRLAITPAQYVSNPTGVYAGTMRTFQDTQFRLYYSSNTESYSDNVPALAAPPAIAHVEATSDNGNVDFQAQVVGDLAAGIQEVWVVYTLCDETGCDGFWQPLDLVQNETDSRLWEAPLVLIDGYGTTDLLYLVQAVNGVGLVTMSINVGQYYSVDVDPGQLPLTGAQTSLSFDALVPTTGNFLTEQSIAVQLMDETNFPSTPIEGQRVAISIGGQQQSAITGSDGKATVLFPLFMPSGSYDMIASYAGSTEYQSSTTSQTFVVTKQPTQLILSPFGEAIDAGTPVIVTLEDDSENPMPGKPIVIVIEDGINQPVTETAITDYLGQSSINLDESAMGPQTITVYFGSDFPETEELTIEDLFFESSTATGTYNLELLGSITIDLDPFAIGSVVEANAVIDRPCSIDANEYLGTWYWGDGAVSQGDVYCESGNSIRVAGSHIYDTSGVFAVRMVFRENFVTVWEGDFRYVTIYDGSDGFVTDGGWITSPPGACSFELCQDDASGKANFGFVAKYKRGAQIPSGKTLFQFRAGNIKFRSTEYEWLVVAGSKAKFKGFGTINNNGLYGFMITAIDGDLNVYDAFENDRFRIRIWMLAAGDIDQEITVYDNKVDDTIDEDTDHTLDIGGGSITVHKTKEN